MDEKEFKYKVGDIVNCCIEEDGYFHDWINAEVIAVRPDAVYPYECKCERYGEETGLFRERELEFAIVN